MSHQSSSPLLRRALLGNAAFSTLCGLVLLTTAGALSPALGIPVLALRVVGLALLPFAYGLARNARQPEVDRREAWVAVAMDFAWVAASAALTFGHLWPLTQTGFWAVLGVADVVLLCAVLQTLGLWKSARVAQPGC